MPRFSRSYLALLVVAFATASLALPAQVLAPGNGAPPEIFTPATRARAEDLLRKMTTPEKLGQMNQFFYFTNSESLDRQVAAGDVGSLLFVTDPVQIDRLQHLAVEHSRLHIPLIFGYDVIHGFRTIFPIPLAMASSWDPPLVEGAQTVAAAEARSVGIAWAFAPMLDIARDPRWGRIMEGAGEDPYLGAAIARAQVRGFQGSRIGAPAHVLACIKHFAGYGAAEGGRDYDASYISDAQLYNVYLPPFHAAIDAGAGSVMSAYMDLNDVPATGNRWLQTTVLRDQWHFQGFVVSDANAVKSLQNHGFARDPADAALKAFNAGINMEMALDSSAQPGPAAPVNPDTPHPNDYDTLPAALKEGRITVAQVDALVRPILEAKIQLGLIDHPYADIARSKQVLDDPAHRTVALHAAERSAVLLRNEGHLLPLGRSAYKKIAVIGPLANGKHDTVGAWAFQQDPEEAVTVLAGLRAKLGTAVKVDYAAGVQIGRLFPSFFDAIFRTAPEPKWTGAQASAEFDKALSLARTADLVILAMGETQDMSGEAASRSSLALPGDQQRLLEAVASLGKPIVLVLLNGRPLDLTSAVAHVPAILEAWHPGTQGGTAVANLLFGDAQPGGKLPLSWPRNVGQIPINYAHNLTQDAAKQGERYWNEPSTPLFPFGFGLSYTTFAFSNLHVAESRTKPGQPIHVTVDVENTGSVAADEVAQLYIHQQSGSASRPVRELKGFSRISLAPHAHQTVTFTLNTPELTFWSPATHTWVEDAATFDVWAGDDSTATLHTSFTRTP